MKSGILNVLETSGLVQGSNGIALRLDLYIIAVCLCDIHCYVFRHFYYNQQSQKQYRNSIRGLLEKYPTFGREKETGLLGALDT